MAVSPDAGVLLQSGERGLGRRLAGKMKLHLLTLMLPLRNLQFFFSDACEVTPI